MASLKTLFLAVFVLLAVTLQATEAAGISAYSKRLIDVKHPEKGCGILTVCKCSLMTSLLSPSRFLTVRDREICADPRLPWVKKILERLNP
uniref:Chemokine interleukin-8-like domain-containing protein n=1 Tax=Suricata suricatta TaxID=37032 RepID=A0A673UVK1_SURSU